jgi:hypothetical protein
MQLHKGDVNGRLEEMRAQIYIRERHKPQSIPTMKGIYTVLDITPHHTGQAFVRLDGTTPAMLYRWNGHSV